MSFFDFYIDTSDVCWGIVGEVNDDYFTVPTAEWAPGIWAGAENWVIQIKDPITKLVKAQYVISKIDLQNREVWHFNNIADIKSGDLIYPKVDK